MTTTKELYDISLLKLTSAWLYPQRRKKKEKTQIPQCVSLLRLYVCVPDTKCLLHFPPSPFFPLLLSFLPRSVNREKDRLMHPCLVVTDTKGGQKSAHLFAFFSLPWLLWLSAACLKRLLFELTHTHMKRNPMLCSNPPNIIARPHLTRREVTPL